MTPLWQDAAAGLLAAGALGWLVVRRLRARRRGATGCEDCPGAMPAKRVTAKAPPRVTVLYSIEPGSTKHKS